MRPGTDSVVADAKAAGCKMQEYWEGILKYERRRSKV